MKQMCILLLAIMATSIAHSAEKKRVVTDSVQISEADKEKSRRVATLEQAKNVVRRNLTDPDSANFRDVFVTPKGAIVCGEVNAKNQVGGYVGFRRFISVGSSVYFDGPESSFVRNSWASECLDPLKNP